MIPLLRSAVLAAAPTPSPSVVLITLDTTRADHVGRVEGGTALTPSLDSLAANGVRFRRALTASPLTLPAHCSLLTGLNPPEHGVRDNGVASLPAGIPTLAEAFARRGYRTAAFVGSRVLDRRFGLARGFDVYDDFIVAERPGEQGYPERDAAQITSAALAWASSAKLDAGRPYFLWVHYYDPHAPYLPPGDWKGASTARRYAGEIAFVDREIGRLLAGLPRRDAGARIVAAVGDHGEMLGAHGEKEHGVFLYEGALAVPLILSGPGIPRGRVVDGVAATRGLAATLLALTGVEAEARAFGAELPGIRSAASPAPVYSETDMPASAYGWSPLAAATDDRRRLIVAPRPELYDLQSDPAESRNLWGKPEEAEAVRRLRSVIAGAHRSARTAAAPADSAELAESLRSLGYLSGSSGRAGSIDPKDGIHMLDDFEQAKELTRSGRAREAVNAFTALVKASPGNVPFLARLAEAQAAAGDVGGAIQTVGDALSLNPGLDFLHLQLARLLVQAGRIEDARAAFRAALAINPRLAPAWLGLAEIAVRSGSAAEERGVLNEAVAANVQSAALYARLAQVELAGGETPAAATHALEALRLLPEFPQAWWIAGEVAEKQGRPELALERFEKAIVFGLADPRAFVRVGRQLLEAGRRSEAEVYLRRAIVEGAGTASAEDARRLLAR